MLEKVRAFIETHRLLDTKKISLVAVSGGADSVALLRILLELGYHVEAAHCNFHLRGQESDRDEQFVSQLCQRLSVPLHLAHFDTRAYAELHKVSIEMAARQLRYKYFEQLRKDIDAEAVCVAHHRDDNAETLLINLLRGTGLHGMVGIRPRRETSQGPLAEACTVVRPLLCVSRSEILEWLQQQGQDFVTDSSNLVDDVVRNKIRLNIIPLLQQINPSAVSNMQRTAELMAEAEHIYDAYTQDMIKKIVVHGTLNISELRQTASPLCILFEWLSRYGFSSATIQQIHENTDASTGSTWYSDTHELCIDRGKLLLMPRTSQLHTMKLPEPGLYVYSEDLHFAIRIQDEISIDHSPACACLDADRVIFPLTVRPARQGDRFVPFGMKGSRLLSDFLTDLKVPLPEKRRQLVVTDATDTLLWVVGRRPSAIYAVTDDTKHMLKITLPTSPSAQS